MDSAALEFPLFANQQEWCGALTRVAAVNDSVRCDVGHAISDFVVRFRLRIDFIVSSRL